MSIVSMVVLFQASFDGSWTAILLLMLCQRVHEDEVSSFMLDEARLNDTNSHKSPPGSSLSTPDSSSF